jgi:hypothetical protein
MGTMTITEGLAEIKTIGKRIEKKRTFVLNYVARQNMFVDVLAKEGGSAAAIERERQAIKDLEERIITIRRAIQIENGKASITIAGITMTVADWLVWRREVAPGRQRFLGQIQERINRVREEAKKIGYKTGPAPTDPSDALGDIGVYLPEKELSAEVERLEEILGTLDGLLSLRNATLTIEV